MMMLEQALGSGELAKTAEKLRECSLPGEKRTKDPGYEKNFRRRSLGIKGSQGTSMPAGSKPPAREFQPGPTSGWRRDRATERRLPSLMNPAPESYSAWKRSGILMITTLEVADYPDGSDEKGPQWHVSFSKHHGRERCSDEECRAALACLSSVPWEEDNHHPGIARNFWCPVDPARRVECECKETETTVVEPDGYKWSNANELLDCRGCELAILTGKPCTLHETQPLSTGTTFDVPTPFRSEQVDEALDKVAAIEKARLADEINAKPKLPPWVRELEFVADVPQTTTAKPWCERRGPKLIVHFSPDVTTRAETLEAISAFVESVAIAEVGHE